MVDDYHLEHTSGILHAHTAMACFGPPCAIHHKTNHRMRSWPQGWSASERALTRICHHDYYHIDPDDPKAHGDGCDPSWRCDGCCRQVDWSEIEALAEEISVDP